MKKICVVGAGRWGKNHIKTLNDLGCLGGIVDSEESALIKYSNWKNLFLYSDIQDAISEKYFDGFVVATPPKTHYQLTKMILNNDKHVLVEKPLTLKYEQSEKLVNLAMKKELKLMVGHVLLFHPAIKKIKELIVSGEIGDLQYIYSNRVNLGQVRNNENVFWSLAPHDISIFQYLVDSYPDNIKVNGSIFLQKGIHDITITQLKYPNNVEGHIFLSWIHPFKEHRIVVIGSDGMISFDDSEKNKPLKFYSKRIEMHKDLPNIIDDGCRLIDYDSSMPLTNQLKFFIDNLDSKTNDEASLKRILDISKILSEASNHLKAKIN